MRREMDEMHFLRMPGPTLMCVMRKYLKKHVPEVRETVGREAALTAAINMADGLEDCVLPMEQFIEEHCAPGTVIVFTI